MCQSAHHLHLPFSRCYFLVGSTSIWLGKLMGHLVSLSIKRCRPEGQTNSASNGLCSLRSASSRSDSEEANTSDDELFRKQHQSASLLIPGSVHPVEAHADEGTLYFCHLKDYFTTYRTYDHSFLCGISVSIISFWPNCSHHRAIHPILDHGGVHHPR